MFRSERLARREIACGGTRRALLARTAPLAAALLVAGCAGPRAVLPDEQGPRPVAWSGRFAATWTSPEDTSREDRGSGRFWLRNLGVRTELEIYSPFGQTLARAGADAARAWLETSDGRRFEADDPQALTEQVLGWRIPVSRLPHWLRGELAAAAGSPTLDAGWSVVSDRAPGQAPRRLTLQWPHQAQAAASRSVTIRLAVDESEGANDG
jgi:outer membrane biogenesis lipoprotein LolB